MPGDAGAPGRQPVAQGRAQRLWRRVRHYVEVARARDDMSGVRYVGIDETSVKRGHAYITVVHDLEAKRLLFATPGRDHATLQDFAQDMRARRQPAGHQACLHRHERGLRQGDRQVAAQCPDQLRPLSCRGAGQRSDGRGASRRNAQLGGRGSRSGRRAEQEDAASAAVGHAQEPGELDPRPVRGDALAATLEPEERAGLAPEAGTAAGLSRCSREQQRGDRARAMSKWLSWARRSRLEPFKRLALTLKGALRWRRARHARRTQQRLRRGDERPAFNRRRPPPEASATSRTSSPWPTCACPSSSIYRRTPWCRPSPATTGATVMFVEESISTGNGIEPFLLVVLVHLSNSGAWSASVLHTSNQSRADE